MNKKMITRALPSAILLASASATAGGVPDCLHAPYGATQGEYEARIEAAAASAEDKQVSPKVMVELVKAEFRMACAAKYKHAGLERYAHLGISARQVARDSVVQLVDADLAAMNHRTQAMLRAHPLGLTVRDFAIQGPRLARESATISIAGVYVHDGNMEYLFANSTDAAMAQSPGYEAQIVRVPLLTDDASDRARSAFLDCSQDPGNLYNGCPMTVKGTATQCQETSAYGGAREIACLEVQDIVDSQ